MFWFSSIIKCSWFVFSSVLYQFEERCDYHLQYTYCITSNDTEWRFVLIIGLFFVVFQFFFWALFMFGWFYLLKSNAHFICNRLRTQTCWLMIRKVERRSKQPQSAGRSIRAFPVWCYNIIYNGFGVFFLSPTLTACYCCCCWNRAIHFCFVAKRIASFLCAEKCATFTLLSVEMCPRAAAKRNEFLRKM